MRETTRVALSAFSIVLAWAPITAAADTFILSTGEQIEGEIVQARTNVIAIRLADGYLKLTYLSEIRQIQISVEVGDRIEGKLLDWTDGVAVVLTGEEILQVRDGKILANMTPKDPSADDIQSTVPPDTEEPAAQSPEADKPAISSAGDEASVTQDDSSPAREATPMGPKERFLKFLRDNEGTELAE